MSTTADTPKKFGNLQGPLRALCCALVVLSLLVPATARAATSPAIVDANATRPAFIPDRGGEVDSTLITYQVLSHSYVRVIVKNSSGRTIRRLVARNHEAGKYRTYWDGRNDAGEVQRPGRYKVRMTARVIGDGSVPGEAGSGVTVGDGADATFIDLLPPPVAVRAVELSRGALGLGRRGSTRISFEMTARGYVSGVITDGRGRVVRTVARGNRNKGGVAVSWDGRNYRGQTMPDGKYYLLIAASKGTRPSPTLKSPLRVDRTRPRMTTSATARGKIVRNKVKIPFSMSVNENARIELTQSGYRKVLSRNKGSYRFLYTGKGLGIVPNKNNRRYTLRVRAIDVGGNKRTRKISVFVPGTGASEPPPPPTSGGGSGVDRNLTFPANGAITSEFGPRWGRMHQGMDIGASMGSRIIAASEGRVSYAGSMDGYGNLVIIDHANGLQTYYAHQKRVAVVLGQYVAKAQVIGYVGSTGNSTGPHLHFETRVNGIARNPRNFLRSS